jgi:hypothetical protein
MKRLLAVTTLLLGTIGLAGAAAVPADAAPLGNNH